MKLTIESTNDGLVYQGIPSRLWHGVDESGKQWVVMTARIAGDEPVPLEPMRGNLNDYPSNIGPLSLNDLIALARTERIP